MEQNNNVSELYTIYKTKMFRMVPKNAKLICQNTFTGKVTVKKSGFRFILPWYHSKLVNITKTVIDYPEEKYLTREGIYVEIDPALTVRITDPIKYEFENANPIQELGILVKDVIRSFVESKTASELIGSNYSIEQKDPGRLFESFESRTGLHVSHLFFKNVKLPKELVDDYEKAKAQELENKRAIAEANSKKEQARINAETKKIEAEISAEAKKIDADAEAYRQEAILKATIALLKRKGYDEKMISEIIKTILISGSNANVIASMGATNTQDVAATMLLSTLGKDADTATKSKPKTRTKKQETTKNNSNNQ